MNDENNKPYDLESELGYNPETHREYTVHDYYEDMKMIMTGHMPKRPMGLPVPHMDVSGITFLLMIPVFLFLIFIKDPFYDWKRWRVVGLIISAVAILVMFGLLIVLSGVFNLPEEHFVIESLFNIGTAGLLGVIVFIWPRTTVLLLLFALVISALSYLIHLIPF
ncbi:MAG: hypothetical protein FHK82_03580 [Sedimenticola thiotaurini]|uniref:Uncharacterized protein n=1 Tax=Sedimenticola thiotaurini TaxID=1543721 RepID=A0A558DCZ5_9GAMM|nr:MAG: hypothetical protein FHK82_03580 [Sedimenticola thiotaurini]